MRIIFTNASSDLPPNRQVRGRYLIERRKANEAIPNAK